MSNDAYDREDSSWEEIGPMHNRNLYNFATAIAAQPIYGRSAKTTTSTRPSSPMANPRPFHYDRHAAVSYSHRKLLILCYSISCFYILIYCSLIQVIYLIFLFYGRNKGPVQLQLMAIRLISLFLQSVMEFSLLRHPLASCRLREQCDTTINLRRFYFYWANALGYWVDVSLPCRLS